MIVNANGASEDATRPPDADVEQRLRERTEQLEAVNREFKAFAGAVSHDLQAPLRHMRGFAQLLRRHLGDAPDDTTRHYVHVIEEAAGRMSRLVEDLLAFSRAGGAEMERRRLEPRVMLEEALDDLRGQMEGRTVDLRVGPLAPVDADPALLRTVFANLLDNALKFSRGRAETVIEVDARPSGDGWVVFSVRDNGAGFDMRDADGLFTVFRRLHPPEQFEGAGIGLAIVRRVVQRHGGRAWAEGTPGAGATFRFTLPAAALS